jgi:hypothetical protein
MTDSVPAYIPIWNVDRNRIIGATRMRDGCVLMDTSAEMNHLHAALLGVVWQFGYRTVYRGKRTIGTGGLSALEGAFEVLGWSDPHEVDEDGCDWPGCEEWATSGTPVPATGDYKRVCGAHFSAIQRGEVPS